MEIQLGYGSGHVTLQIPQPNTAAFVRPGGEGPVLPEASVAPALRRTAAWQHFRQSIQGRRLCVLLPDATRDLPLEVLLPGLLADLTECQTIQCVVCTGTHDAQAEANIEQAGRIGRLLAAAGLAEETFVHDCRDAAWVEIGRTAYGTPIRYNAILQSADVFLVLSDVKPHYFAGYSNPVKNFVPGLCHFDTAERNHSLALDDRSTFGRHPWHPDPKRRDNPLAADQAEAMDAIVADRPVWAIVTICTHAGVQWAHFDTARHACEEAFAEADRRNAFYLTPTRHLVVSPGGLPNDVDLYIAQRALELTQNAVVDGGEILFLSACPGGVGEAHTRAEFYDRLTCPLDELLRSPREEYKLFSHKPIKFARMIHRLHRLWVHSEIPDELLAAAHLDPAPNPQAVIDAWLDEDPNVRICIVDGANKVAIYPAE